MILWVACVILSTFYRERDCCSENCWENSCFFVFASERMWNESRQYCRNKDGDVVIINSNQEHVTGSHRGENENYILFFFPQKSLNDNIKMGIWIGLSDTVRGSLEVSGWYPTHREVRLSPCFSDFGHFQQIIAYILNVNTSLHLP